MSQLAGAVVWAVVPLAPEPPFRLYAGENHPPLVVSDAGTLVAAARRSGDPQFTFLVPGKVRPVLVLSDEFDPRLGELIALRLARLGALSEENQRRVREAGEPTLFYLEPDRFPGLPEENAAMIGALVRVHRDALLPEPVGWLDAQELAVVHERIARHYRLNLHALVLAEIRRLGDEQRRRGS